MAEDKERDWRVMAALDGVWVRRDGCNKSTSRQVNESKVRFVLRGNRIMRGGLNSVSITGEMRLEREERCERKIWRLSR
jgi:hypothetical protein